MFSRIGSSLGKSARYCDTGRSELFQKYVEDMRLSDLLVDTVVPAVTRVQVIPHIYSLITIEVVYIILHTKLKMFLCVRLLHPHTYFDPYKLDSNLYVDGGVQANNPALEALGQALGNGVRQENVYMLSLGTGDYVPDPLHLNAS